MVQVLSPINILSHKPHASSLRCTPLTRRRTLPTIRDLTFSHSWRQNALERVAVRKLTAQLLATSHLSPFSNLDSFSSSQPAVVPTISTPSRSFTPGPAGVSASAEELLPQEIPSTPPTPLDVVDYYPEPEHQPEPKANIFNNTTKSDALLGVYMAIKVDSFHLTSESIDLTLAALHRIYVDDYSDASWSSQSQLQPAVAQAQAQPTWLAPPRATFNCYDQSPPSTCGSSLSSASSTPSQIPTPPVLSPEFNPEIVGHTASYSQTYGAPAAKPVARTQSLPSQARPAPPQPQAQSMLGDEGTLRWFLVELLRRSRASASVVQLALHYLGQARTPVGGILNQRFKAGPARDGTGQDDEDKGKDGEGEDSPLLDPRRLLLAALMLSTKLLHDHAPNNRAWARVCGLAPRDVGACERALGQALDWKLANMFVGPRDSDPVVV